VLELEGSRGVCAGRNRGIETATGDVLVFLDDDASFAAPDALSRIRARFERDPALGIVTTRSLLAATGEPERDAIPHRDKRSPTGDREVSYFCGVGFALRRSLAARLGGFAEDFVFLCEELDLSWRAVEAGARIVWATDVVVLHRRTPLERPPGRWVYANMRNRVRLALAHLPWPFVLSYAVAWWPWLLLHAVRHRTLADFGRGLRDFCRLAPASLRARRVLPRATRRAIRGLGGRLLC
jgi:GT2 family glycosyltransferase